jgi:hypothetical protein
MTLDVTLPALTEPDAELWPLLFELADDIPEGWALVGAQMVVLHAAAHGLNRPARTRDVDVLVDLRSLRPNEIVDWLKERGFELSGVSPEGVGHEFRRQRIRIDVLGTDHAGPRTDKTTVPPVRTVEVPGGRRAVGRLTVARVTAGSSDGVVPLPDWLGALQLKARAAVELSERVKHLQDVALLLGLPVDVAGVAAGLSGKERTQLQRAIDLLDEGVWSSVGGIVDVRAARAAARLVGRPSEA